MKKLLISHESEEFSQSLVHYLKSKFDITVCRDGNTASRLIQSLQPEILLLDLVLPYKDGITVLNENRKHLPPHILLMIKSKSDYIYEAIAPYKVDYLMYTNCGTRTVAAHILRIADDKWQTNTLPMKRQRRTAEILLKLNIPAERDGFTQLRVGVPMFVEDPAQRLSKELYPAIAEHCGYGNALQVEHSIRTAIIAGWKQRNNAVWRAYFPDYMDETAKYPSNKVFISRLANLIRE